jgi:DNA-binding response OmpR family regulator
MAKATRRDDQHDTRPDVRSAPALANDHSVQRDLAALLTSLDDKAVIAESADDAEIVLGDHRCAFTLLDLNTKGHDGHELLQRLRVHSEGTGPVIMSSRNGVSPGADSNGHE